jgi:hypothetical protein
LVDVVRECDEVRHLGPPGPGASNILRALASLTPCSNFPTRLAWW